MQREELQQGYMRKTFLVKIEFAQKFDAQVFWERNTVKEVMPEAMNNYILAWESKNGPEKMSDR